MFAQGEAIEPSRLLFEAAKHAENAGDHIGSTINAACGYHVQRLGRLIDPLKAKVELQLLRAELEKQTRGPRVDAWLLNIDMDLFQTACALNDCEAARHYASLALRGEMMRRGKGMRPIAGLREPLTHNWRLLNIGIRRHLLTLQRFLTLT